MPVEPLSRSQQSIWSQILNEYVSAGTAVIFCKSLFAPFDRLVIVYQTQSESTGQKIKIKGIFASLGEIARSQGFKSLWRGNMVNVIKSVPGHAQTFTMHKMVYRYMIQAERDPPWQRVAFCSTFAATASGMTACAMYYPMYFCQTVFAANLSPTARDHGRFFGRTRVKSLTITDCVTRYRLNQLYVGVVASVLASGFHRMVYFGMYDVYKALFHSDTTSSFTPRTMMMAQLVSVLAISVSHPLDTVARRQIVKFVHTNDVGPSSWQFFLQIVGQEGYMGVYKGLLTNIMKSTSSGLMLILTDAFRSILYK